MMKQDNALYEAFQGGSSVAMLLLSCTNVSYPAEANVAVILVHEAKFCCPCYKVDFFRVYSMEKHTGF